VIARDRRDRNVIGKQKQLQKQNETRRHFVLYSALRAEKIFGTGPNQRPRQNRTENFRVHRKIFRNRVIARDRRHRNVIGS
jgi:hypothetical protein